MQQHQSPRRKRICSNKESGGCLNNTPTYHIMMATQEDYDRIQARIDKLNESVAEVHREYDKIEARLRSC